VQGVAIGFGSSPEDAKRWGSLSVREKKICGRDASSRRHLRLIRSFSRPVRISNKRLKDRRKKPKQKFLVWKRTIAAARQVSAQKHRHRKREKKKQQKEKREKETGKGGKCAEPLHLVILWRVLFPSTGKCLSRKRKKKRWQKGLKGKGVKGAARDQKSYYSSCGRLTSSAKRKTMMHQPQIGASEKKRVKRRRNG